MTICLQQRGHSNRHQDGSHGGGLPQHKARVVVLGNQETRSPNERLSRPQPAKTRFDVTSAFTYADLDDPVFVRLPKQFDENGKSVIWKLNKSLYGLRRAPYLWFEKFTACLKSEGYTQSPYDPCAFKKREGANFIFSLFALMISSVPPTATRCNMLSQGA